MRATVIAAAAAVGAMACGGASQQVKPTDDGEPKAAAYWELDEGAGVVLTSDRTGTVPMRVVETGETFQLRDGEPLEMKQLFAGEGLGRAEAQVSARGQIGVVPNPSVVVEHRLTRVEGADFVVFTAVSACDPDCKSEIWVLGQDGWRVRATEEAKTAPTHVAVHPKGRSVAIGGHGLWVVDVPDGRVRHWDEFTSPTYDQHGVLFARGVGADDSVYEMGEFGNGVLLHTEPGPPPSGARGEPAPDAAPIRFAEDGRTILATFVRKGKEVERRIER